jgi:hypothetical protein
MLAQHVGVDPKGYRWVGVAEPRGHHVYRERTVILDDLAAVEAAQRNPEAACAYAEQALEQLGLNWYATGMDRVLDVRKALQPWTELDCVQALDDRSTAGRPPSVRCSIKCCELAGQLGQRIDPHRRYPSASGSARWMMAHGPRLIRAVLSPRCAAGRTSLSSRSPT